MGQNPSALALSGLFGKIITLPKWLRSRALINLNSLARQSNFAPFGPGVILSK